MLELANHSVFGFLDHPFYLGICWKWPEILSDEDLPFQVAFVMSLFLGEILNGINFRKFSDYQNLLY